MIIKPRVYPEQLLQLKALLSRLPASHPKITSINNEYQPHYAGWYGEQSMDYYYRRLDFLEAIFVHNVRLFYHGDHFQMDTLLLTPSFFSHLGNKEYIREADL